MSDIVDQQLVQVPVTSSHIQQKDTTFTKIFVGGLPYHTTDKSLKQFFESFGEIEEAVVITDRQTGKSRGYGFVTMADREAAERAVKDANPIIDGRKANVNLAYLGAKPRINAQNGFQSHLRSTYPYVIPSQYGSVNNTGLLKSFDSHEKWPTLLDYQGLSPHYVYHTPSAYMPTSGLILSGPPPAAAPLSPAATAASFYTEYATSYPPQYGNGLEYASYAGALAPTALPHGNGAASLPPYLGGHPAAYAAYALPPQGMPPSAGAAHFPIPPYPGQSPQDARMQ